MTLPNKISKKKLNNNNNNSDYNVAAGIEDISHKKAIRTCENDVKDWFLMAKSGIPADDLVTVIRT